MQLVVLPDADISEPECDEEDLEMENNMDDLSYDPLTESEDDLPLSTVRDHAKQKDPDVPGVDDDENVPLKQLLKNKSKDTVMFRWKRIKPKVTSDKILSDFFPLNLLSTF